MSTASDLTLFIGPQTRLSLAINAIVRGHRGAFARAGLNVRPGRLATPDLRKNLDRDVPLSLRRAEFAVAVGSGPAFLSAINFLGPPVAAFHQREVFPESEGLLAELPTLAEAARIVLSLDVLSAFFLAARSEPLEARVRSAGWETLYDLSWADLIEEVAFAMPGSEVLVLTPKGAALRSPEVLERLFGPAASVVPSRWHLMQAALNETGQAVLAKMIAEAGEDNAPSAETLGELYDSFAERADPAMLGERLGVDKVTAVLLEQRFREDLDRIAAMPRVEVI